MPAGRALTGVVEFTIDDGKLGADRSGIVAAIGPLIRQHPTKSATLWSAS
jgi:hypothetical protein